MPPSLTTLLKSENQSVHISPMHPTVIIGERINPAGRVDFQAELRAGNFERVQKEAEAQILAGAQLLDINAWVSGLDEISTMRQMVKTLIETVNVPLVFDSIDLKVLESALQIYRGKALLNSVTGTNVSLNAVLPLAKEYQSAVVGLCLDENGIPPAPQSRLAVAEKILNRAVQRGIAPEDVIIDPLALAFKKHGAVAVQITLKTARLIRDELGVNQTLGISNHSFGMKNREAMNADFATLAIRAGITCPIVNPLQSTVIAAIRAVDRRLGR